MCAVRWQDMLLKLGYVGCVEIQGSTRTRLDGRSPSSVPKSRLLEDFGPAQAVQASLKNGSSRFKPSRGSLKPLARGLSKQCY